MAEQRAAGRLLVASPSIGDPRFARTVILVIEHSGLGALGVVLNRTSELDVAGKVNGWDERAVPPAMFFFGGPVERGTVIGLGRHRDGLAIAARLNEADEAHLETAADTATTWRPVIGDVGVVDLASDPVATPEVTDLRFFSGYAGWGAGQLDGELDLGGWFVLPAETTDPLDPTPDDLWERVVRRQGGRYVAYLHYPDDPKVN